MSRRTPRLVLRTLAVAGVALLAFVAWLRWNPLAQIAGPLDTLLPDGAQVVARFDPGDVLAAPVSSRLWKLPSVVEFRATSGLEESVLQPAREMSDRVALASLGLAPSAPEALLGDEVLVAVYGDDVLVLSRLYARGRVVDLARSLGEERLEKAGLRMHGDTAIFDREGAPQLFLTRFRDTVAISTRQDLAEAVPVIGAQGDEFPPGPGPLADLGEPGSRILIRGEAALVARWGAQLGAGSATAGDVGNDSGGGLHPAVDVVLDLMGPEGARTATVIIDLAASDELRIDIAVEYGAAWPDVLDALPTIAADTGTRWRNLAGLFAVEDETIVAGGLAVRALDAVRTLVDAQPPSRRALLDDLLAERGLTVELVAQGIASHLEDGLGFVVARLNEADALELDDPAAGGVHPVPATLVAFDLKGNASPDAALAAIIEESTTLFGAQIEFSDRDLPDGIELFRLSEHRFGGEWELLRPAVAVVGRRLVFCTHEDFLLRALRKTPAADLISATGAEPGSSPAGVASTLDLVLTGAPLRRYVDDQRWAWADQATVHDWRAERRAIRNELDREGSVLRPEDRQTYEDTRIAARLAARNRDEFPAAIEAYRTRWAGLEDLGGIEIQASAARAGLRLRVDVLLD